MDARSVRPFATWLGDGRLRTERLSQVIHGTTVCSNAILEGKGARTGLLTTRGFRDTLEIGRMRYPRLYDLTWIKPPPLVDRRRRREVVERLDRDGGIVDGAGRDVRAGGAADPPGRRRRVARGVPAAQLCRTRRTKQRVREIVARIAPQLPISLSCEVLPEIGEYERTSTTVINAYLQPVAGSYLAQPGGRSGRDGRTRAGARHAVQRRHHVGAGRQLAADPHCGVGSSRGGDRRAAPRPAVWTVRCDRPRHGWYHRQGIHYRIRPTESRPRVRGRRLD